MSAFYDLASLVVVPSGYKASKVYAQKPLTTDGQLAFTRSTTATRVNSAGLIEASAINVPRLDYLGSTCPKLLLEPSRTNLNVHSSDISNAAWDLLNVVTTSYINQVVAPDGTTTADKMIPNTTSDSYHGVQLSSGRPTLTGSAVYTFSVFAKAQGYDKIRVQNFSQGVRAQFNLTTGTLINQSGTSSTFITPYGNGWYRIGFTYTQSGTLGAYWNTLVISTDDNSGSAPVAWAGNGTDSIAVWGHTIEEGAYATSYIPTLGASVTRGADAASKTGISSLIGQTEGTLFIEIDPQDITGSGRYISMESASGVGSGWVGIFSNGGTPNTFRFYGDGWDFNSGPALRGVRSKAAFSYKNGVLTSAYVNGVSVGTLTAYTTGKSYSKLEIASGPFGNDGSCNYHKALIFKTALTNAQLAELTTI